MGILDGYDKFVKEKQNKVVDKEKLPKDIKGNTWSSTSCKKMAEKV
jgi:hypothetical protein